MAEKRRRRTAQELIEDIEKQIEAARGEIEAQQAKLEEIKKGTAAKMSPKEIAEKLGIDL